MFELRDTPPSLINRGKAKFLETKEVRMLENLWITRTNKTRTSYLFSALFSINPSLLFILLGWRIILNSFHL
jgi:hypothetical protein